MDDQNTITLGHFLQPKNQQCLDHALAKLYQHEPAKYASAVKLLPDLMRHFWHRADRDMLYKEREIESNPVQQIRCLNNYFMENVAEFMDLYYRRTPAGGNNVAYSVDDGFTAAADSSVRKNGRESLVDTNTARHKIVYDTSPLANMWYPSRGRILRDDIPGDTSRTHQITDQCFNGGPPGDCRLANGASPHSGANRYGYPNTQPNLPYTAYVTPNANATLSRNHMTADEGFCGRPTSQYQRGTIVSDQRSGAACQASSGGGAGFNFGNEGFVGIDNTMAGDGNSTGKAHYYEEGTDYAIDTFMNDPKIQLLNSEPCKRKFDDKRYVGGCDQSSVDSSPQYNVKLWATPFSFIDESNPKMFNRYMNRRTFRDWTGNTAPADKDGCEGNTTDRPCSRDGYYGSGGVQGDSADAQIPWWRRNMHHRNYDRCNLDGLEGYVERGYMDRPWDMSTANCRVEANARQYRVPYPQRSANGPGDAEVERSESIRPFMSGPRCPPDMTFGRDPSQRQRSYVAPRAPCSYFND